MLIEGSDLYHMNHPEKFLQQLEDLREEAVMTRRHLHQNPELSRLEFKTAEYIERRLDALDIPHRRVGPTGVYGILKGKKHGRGIVALRADIDALPIQEKSDVTYKSLTDGVMHACGHDANMTCLLEACRLLKDNTDKFGGEIRLIFQPAEETGGYPQEFVDEGILEGAESIFGLHCAPDLPSGKIGLKVGLNNAAVDLFHIEIYGKSSHVSSPQLGVDALYIACQTVVDLQAIVTRMTNPVEPCLIGVGKLESGTIYNAVASLAVLEGTTRTVTTEARKFIREEIKKITEDCADAYGGTCSVEFTKITSPLYNDEECTAHAIKTAASLFGKENIITDRPLSLNGDDYAEFMEPTGLRGCYAYLGTGNPEIPHSLHNVHSCDFDIDETALTTGAGLYAGYAMDWLA